MGLQIERMVVISENVAATGSNLHWGSIVRQTIYDSSPYDELSTFDGHDTRSQTYRPHL